MKAVVGKPARVREAPPWQQPHVGRFPVSFSFLFESVFIFKNYGKIQVLPEKGAVTEELLKSSENGVRIRTFAESSDPDNIFKISSVSPCPSNEAMYFTMYLYGGRGPYDLWSRLSESQRSKHSFLRMKRRPSRPSIQGRGGCTDRAGRVRGRCKEGARSSEECSAK